jgi:protease-4
MPRPNLHPASVETALRRLRVRAQNALSYLPGDRPEWVVVDLSGPLVARAVRPRFFGFPLPPHLVPEKGSLEEISETLASLARAEWLRGVLFRIDGVRTDLATLYGLRRAMSAIRRAGKETRSYLTRIDWTDYYLASAAAEIVAPESAELSLHGLGLSVTFMRDALARFGVRFEKLAIREYKNAFDELVRQEMSTAQREQLEALLARFEEHLLAEVAESRGKAPEVIRGLVDEGITSAARAREVGLVDRVAYEDEIVGRRHQPLHHAKRFLRLEAPAAHARRVAVVSLQGTIVPGKSRHAPIPLPLFGGQIAGSETIVRALRAADEDRGTAAIVFHVDSGGGSALASDLIWRELRRIRDRKPVVAVMGAVAASGGYYVLTHAHRILAAPTTITGSIGVFTGKPVLADFYEKYGLHNEQVKRDPFALLHHPARPFTDEQRALIERSNEEVYRRFVARVAEGRRLTVDQVDAIGRGRIWAGSEALRVGLVDELGDVDVAIDRARELARLPPGAPVWNVGAPRETLLPNADDPTTALRQIEPFLRAPALLFMPLSLTVV